MGNERNKLLVSDTFLRKCKADDICVEIDKYFLAYEIEAYGREKGLLAMFLIRWKEIEEALEINY